MLGLIREVAPALAAGNTVVAIVSRRWPLRALDLGEVAGVSDVPGGVLNLLCGRMDELLTPLCGHRDVNAIVDATGETRAGGDDRRARRRDRQARHAPGAGRRHARPAGGADGAQDRLAPRRGLAATSALDIPLLRGFSQRLGRRWHASVRSSESVKTTEGDGQLRSGRTLLALLAGMVALAIAAPTANASGEILQPSTPASPRTTTASTSAAWKSGSGNPRAPAGPAPTCGAATAGTTSGRRASRARGCGPPSRGCSHAGTSAAGRGSAPRASRTAAASAAPASRFARSPRGGHGERGIRTPGRVSPSHDFQSCPFSRSGTSPGESRERLARRRRYRRRSAGVRMAGGGRRGRGGRRDRRRRDDAA